MNDLFTTIGVITVLWLVIMFWQDYTEGRK